MNSLEKNIRDLKIILIVIVSVIGISMLTADDDYSSSKCKKSNCDWSRSPGSSYCFVHKGGTSSGSTTRKSSTSSKKSDSSSGSKTGTYKQSAYDKGYDDIYYDDDFDWDRYMRDDDYASGVDDAMEDEDW